MVPKGLFSMRPAVLSGIGGNSLLRRMMRNLRRRIRWCQCAVLAAQ